MDKSILFHVADQELAPSQSIYANITDIDTYADSSLNEILYQDLCDYFSVDETEILLKKAYAKLNHGGIIHVQGSDLKQLCIAVSFHMISEDIVKRVLYPNKKSIHMMSEILEIMKKIGFTIDNKKYVNIFEYYIKASKV